MSDPVPITAVLGGTLNAILIGGGTGAPVGSVAIGSALQVLRVNAGGTALEYAAAASAGSPGGSSGQVQFHDAGAFGGDGQLTFDKTSGLVTVTGAGATGATILKTLPGGGTSYVNVNDNGTVVINSDVTTGSYPLRILHNSVELCSVSYQGIWSIATGGYINIGAGYLYLEGGATRSGIRTFGPLTLSPAALGGSGAVEVVGAINATSTITAPAATTAISSIRVPHGTAPTSPTDGDIWTTTAGQFQRINGVTHKIGGETRQISFTIGDGTNVITTGRKAGIQIPYNCVITGWSIFEDGNVTGSIVVDIWRDAYANFPPVVADTIAAAAKPTLTAAVKAEDNTLTGWTTTVTAGDYIVPNVDSVATVKKVVVVLRVRLS